MPLVSLDYQDSARRDPPSQGARSLIVGPGEYWSRCNGWVALQILRVPDGPQKLHQMVRKTGQFIAESADSVDKEMSQYSGGSMKKYAVALLSLAGSLALTPVAS